MWNKTYLLTYIWSSQLYCLLEWLLGVHKVPWSAPMVIIHLSWCWVRCAWGLSPPEVSTLFLWKLLEVDKSVLCPPTHGGAKKCEQNCCCAQNHLITEPSKKLEPPHYMKNPTKGRKKVNEYSGTFFAPGSYGRPAGFVTFF